MNIVIIAILVLICVSLSAAWLILWEKYEAEKDKRWDEISRSAGLEKELDMVVDANWKLAHEAWKSSEELRLCGIENYKLHSKLSSILCPTNNHVWKDGVCVKCGRAQHGQN